MMFQMYSTCFGSLRKSTKKMLLVQIGSLDSVVDLHWKKYLDNCLNNLEIIRNYCSFEIIMLYLRSGLSDS
jgi:hypothetical protein